VTEHDPFAPPQSNVDGRTSDSSAYAFVAERVGSDLMIQKRAPLPPVCVKCARPPVVFRRDYQFSWTPPWVLLFIVLGVLPYVLLAAAARKRGDLTLPICGDCDRRWRAANAWLGLSIVWAFFGLVGSVVVLVNELPWLALFFLFSAVVTPILVQSLVFRPRALRARRIDQRTITVVGLHPETQAAILEAARGDGGPTTAPAVTPMG
jgi:hypothetical protein